MTGGVSPGAAMTLLEGEEDQKLLGVGHLRKSETKRGGRAGKQPKRLHKSESVGQTAFRPYAPTSAMRHDNVDDDEKKYIFFFQLKEGLTLTCCRNFSKKSFCMFHGM